MLRRFVPGIVLLAVMTGVATGCEDLSNLISGGPDESIDAAPPTTNGDAAVDVAVGSDATTDATTDTMIVDADVGTSDATDSGPDVVVPLGCNGVLACERVVFVTSAIFTSDLGGLPGADAKCQALANSAGAHARVKGRTFRAWLSAGATPAAGRHPHGTAKYVRPDDIEVASSWNDLVDGTITSPIAVNEKNQVENNDPVWTGTSASGAGAGASYYCNDWAADGLGVGWAGMLGSATSTWTDNAGLSCSGGATLHLYCVEY